MTTLNTPLSRGYLGGVALALLIIYPPLVALHEIAPVVAGSSNIPAALTVSLDPSVGAYGQHPSTGSSDLAPVVAALSFEPENKTELIAPALMVSETPMTIVLPMSTEPDVDAYGQHPSAGSSDLAPTVYAGGCC